MLPKDPGLDWYIKIIKELIIPAFRSSELVANWKNGRKNHSSEARDSNLATCLWIYYLGNLGNVPVQ